MPHSKIMNNPNLDGYKVNRRNENAANARQKRRSVADHNRKVARDKLLNNKRRMPLCSSEQEQNKLKKSDERREKLKQWKEQRDKRKEQLQRKTKKGFVIKHVTHSPAKFLGVGRKCKEKSLHETVRKNTKLVEKCDGKENAVFNVLSSVCHQDAPVFTLHGTTVAFPFSHEVTFMNNFTTEKKVSLTPPKPESTCCEEEVEEEENAGPRFRLLVQEETDKLNSLCSRWEASLDTEDIPEGAQGDIRSTIGQAKLLIDQRFGQFSGLITLHENKTGEKETKASDLEGFWGMIYYQVEDVHKKFADIEEKQSRSWEEPKVEKKRRGRKKAKPTEELKEPTAPVKRRGNFHKFKAELKAKMEAAKEEAQGSMGFISVLTPMKKRKSVAPDESQTQSVLLTSVRRSTRKRKSIVPELDFSSEPTYVLPASVFEDCLRSSSSEWPVAILPEEQEINETSDSPVITTTAECSPACIEGISLLRLRSPVPADRSTEITMQHNNVEQQHDFKEPTTPALMRYLVRSQGSPEVTPPASTNTNEAYPAVTPSRSLRPRRSNLIVFSP